MRILVKTQLSPHKYKTPEGYLYCKDSIIARTGKQTYLKSELYPGSESDETIDVDRPFSEVTNPLTIASFEDKPITNEHPDENVGPDNYNELAIGHTKNVRVGPEKVDGETVLLADLIITDAQAINDIENGKCELSCGYDCDITDDDEPKQINIRGNHVALCECGRAGCARIIDSKTINDTLTNNMLIQEFGKNATQYKIVKIDKNTVYAEDLIFKKLTLFRKDRQGIDWDLINKSDVKDSVPVIDRNKYRLIRSKLYQLRDSIVKYERKNLYDSLTRIEEKNYNNLVNQYTKLKNSFNKYYANNKVIRDSMPDLDTEMVNIKKLLSNLKTDITIDKSYGAITIDIDNTSTLNKAFKILNNYYDCEKNIEMSNIIVYDKFDKDTIFKDSSPIISDSDSYNQFNRKFYVKALDQLQRKLDKLNKQITLDANNNLYNHQKTKYKQVLLDQIKEYKLKLKEIDKGE